MPTQARSWLGAVAVTLVVATALACSPPPERRVLIVGIDGAAPTLVASMMEEGLLPNLSALSQEGLNGTLASEFPLLSPRIWTTVATGKGVPKHGIANFVLLDDQKVKRLYTSNDRKTHALWNMASDRGLTVAVVNWMITHPPELVNGAMISDHAVPGILGLRHNLAKQFAQVMYPTVDGPVEAPYMDSSVAAPQEWNAKVKGLIETRESITEFENPFEGKSGFHSSVPLPIISYVFENDALVTRMALQVEKDLHPDVMMVYLPGIDRVSHWLWGSLEPSETYPERLRRTPPERAVGAAALKLYYRYTDALIGLLLENYSPGDLIIVLSDHGFEGGVIGNGAQTGIHESLDASKGVLFVRAPELKSDASLEGFTVRDVTPTVLTWLGLPTAADQDGQYRPLFDLPETESIETYDTTEIERVGSEQSGSEDAIIEHLRELGYVE